MGRLKVFVTGAGGFVGRHLVASLRGREMPFAAVSRARPEPTPEGESWRAPEIYADDAALRAALQGIDVIVHLAAHAHQTRDTGDADRALFQQVNVDLTARLWTAARVAGVKQFIFLSSVGAVASESEAVIDEATAPHPSTDYGQSKRAAEVRLQELATAGGPAVTILRPCLVYGRGNPGNLERLAGWIERGIPLPLGTVKNRRSLVHVESLVVLIHQVMLNPRCAGETFMVADDDFVSTAEVCRAIAQARGRSARIFPFPVFGLLLAGRLGDGLGSLTGRRLPMDSYSIKRLAGSLVCSNRKARELAGWQPRRTSVGELAGAFSLR